MGVAWVIVKAGSIAVVRQSYEGSVHIAMICKVERDQVIGGREAALCAFGALQGFASERARRSGQAMRTETSRVGCTALIDGICIAVVLVESSMCKGRVCRGSAS